MLPIRITLAGCSTISVTDRGLSSSLSTCYGCDSNPTRSGSCATNRRSPIAPLAAQPRLRPALLFLLRRA